MDVWWNRILHEADFHESVSNYLAAAQLLSKNKKHSSARDSSSLFPVTMATTRRQHVWEREKSFAFAHEKSGLTQKFTSEYKGKSSFYRHVKMVAIYKQSLQLSTQPCFVAETQTQIILWRQMFSPNRGVSFSRVLLGDSSLLGCDAPSSW
jgi:hypothetical protein